MEHEVTYWFVFLGLVVAPLAAHAVLVRSGPDGWLARLGARALERLTDPDDPDDPVAEHAAELAAVLRRERLLRDLQRVQHLVATDAWMSAVRQIGNRMAHEQLLHDLRTLPQVSAPVAIGAGTGWELSGLQVPSSSVPSSSVSNSSGASGYGGAPGRSVETLDFGWRR